MCAWEEEIRKNRWPALSFISLFSCTLPFKAVLSMAALGLWTKITIGRHSVWGNAILHAQQSCLGSSQLFASPEAVGPQFKSCWLPQGVKLECWWHTQTDWAGAGIKHTPNYSWHINFMLRIRYTSCYFLPLVCSYTTVCSHSCMLVPELRGKLANMILLRLVLTKMWALIEVSDASEHAAESLQSIKKTIDLFAVFHHNPENLKELSFVECWW